MLNPSMLTKLKQMQEDLKRVQAEINASTFYGQAGGSAVRVAVKGTKEVISLDIKKEALDPNDLKMLESLIIVALNDAFQKVDREIEESMGSLTKNVNLSEML